MAFDIGAGLHEMGKSVAQTAGAYTLESQKAELEQQKVLLADQLAGAREATQRNWQGGESEKERGWKTGESLLNRTSEEKRATITADAHVRGAGITAGGTIEAARLTSEGHKESAKIYAGSRTDVADINNKTKLELKTMADKSGLTSEALDTAATAYNINGQLPAYGMGGAAVKLAIQNRASEMRKESGTTPEDWMKGTAGAAAAKPALANLDKQSSMANAFSGTAEKNGDLLLSLMAKGAGPTGRPVIDRWIQAGRRNVEGDPDVTAFNIAMETFKTENAKVLSGATGAAGITDAARAHVDALLSNADNPKAIEAAVKTFALERQNRLSSYEDQRQALLGRMSGGEPTAKSSPSAVAPPGGITAPPAAKTRPIPMKRDGTPDASELVPGTIYDTPGMGPMKWTGTGMVRP